ncbi:MAG: octanoyltransferase [Betaproteobacteria bacterium HGW-Betaproteobacteria-22]|nr:MAG: octanoyltransferase [Betaproteobacteria bacterium HGW-Betaproteobacteria-22]
MTNPILIKHLGVTDFENTCQAMQAFTLARTNGTPDEIWVTEHHPVYSLGLNRKNVIPPARQDIPLVCTDRGGKITYHGPGQVVIYTLLDLPRHQLNIRSLVSLLESSVIELLADFQVTAAAKQNAPGVYVSLQSTSAGAEAKIASLGLRVKNNVCYHGLSLNVDMDLSPFNAIDPCGYAGLAMTQTKDLGISADTRVMADLLLKKLTGKLESSHD